MVQDLKTLFLTLVEEQDLKAAALRCGTTQQMIRSSIAQLEAEQGSKLCVIQKKKVLLTKEGKQFCYSLLPADAKNPVIRLVRVMQDSMSEHGVPKWMSRVADRSWPFLEIESTKGNSAQQISSLISGAIDIVMMYGFPHVDRSQLTFEQLCDQDLAVFMTERAHLGYSQAVSLESLRSKRIIHPSSVVMPGIGDLLRWECRKAGFAPRTIPSSIKAHFFDEILSEQAIGIAPSNFMPDLPTGISKVPLEPRITIPFGCLHRADVPSSAIRYLLHILYRIADADQSKAEEAIPKPKQSPFAEILRSVLITNPNWAQGKWTAKDAY